jgi:hypothetical protein
MAFPIRAVELFTAPLQIALLLFDRFTGAQNPLGGVTVTSGFIQGLQKPGTGVFVFANLKPGPQNLVVASAPDTPYYRTVTIPVTVPAPAALWPAYPDVTLANPALPLNDPGQTAAYLAQRQLAGLLPTPAYPFVGATLARGRVTAGGLPLAAATVLTVGGNEIPYVTGPSGEFVLFFEQAPRDPTTVTLRASHAALPNKDVAVQVTRGATVSAEIAM